MINLADLLREEEALSEELTRMERVSSDSAHSQSWRLRAIRRAISALRYGNVILTSPHRVLVMGVETLPEAVLERFIQALRARKSRGNSALLALDGQRGEIIRGEEAGCWVIDLASPRGTTLYGWEFAGEGLRGGPRLYTTNGDDLSTDGYTCGLLGETARQYLAGKACQVTSAWLDRAVALHQRTGLTPLQDEALQAQRKLAESRRARA